MFGLGKAKNRRKVDRKPLRLPAIAWRRWALPGLSLIGVAVALAAVLWALDQPIETIAVDGRFQRVQAVDVEQAVKERVRGAGLITVNLESVRHAIRQIPWVDNATVQRAWPRGLRVVVSEQVAAARWGTNGLLNSRGELFVSESRHIPPELPKLSGPPGAENQVAQRYLAIQGRLVEAGMRITALRLDARGAWEIDLDNGVVVRLGRRQIDERFERFVAAALKLVSQRASDIAYVDMRYTNGFAVGWKGANPRVATGPTADEDNPEA